MPGYFQSSLRDSPQVVNAPNDDPLFVNAVDEDYHLKSSSPAIDAGDSASDYGNEPDPDDGRVNMGRHGNTL
ncbi:hypothetical protein QUF80_13515 [Desulfococcaceae bacterium HSG8]|nr:hypothetical protein [Desulfococcaceae bacterium HSG8]